MDSITYHDASKLVQKKRKRENEEWTQQEIDEHKAYLFHPTKKVENPTLTIRLKVPKSILKHSDNSSKLVSPDKALDKSISGTNKKTPSSGEDDASTIAYMHESLVMDSSVSINNESSLSQSNRTKRVKWSDNLEDHQPNTTESMVSSHPTNQQEHPTYPMFGMSPPSFDDIPEQDMLLLSKTLSDMCQEHPTRIPSSKHLFRAKEKNMSELARKEVFLLLLRALIRHLSETNPTLLDTVNIIIRQCDMRNREGIDPYYQSLSKSIQMRLMPIIDDKDWDKAEELLVSYLLTKFIKADVRAHRKRSRNFYHQVASRTRRQELRHDAIKLARQAKAKLPGPAFVQQFCG